MSDISFVCSPNEQNIITFLVKFKQACSLFMFAQRFVLNVSRVTNDVLISGIQHLSCCFHGCYLHYWFSNCISLALNLQIHTSTKTVLSSTTSQIQIVNRAVLSKQSSIVENLFKSIICHVLPNLCPIGSQCQIFN